MYGWPYSYTAVFLQRDVSPDHDHQSHQNQDDGQTPWRDFPESENPMTIDDGCLCKTALAVDNGAGPTTTKRINLAGQPEGRPFCFASSVCSEHLSRNWDLKKVNSVCWCSAEVLIKRGIHCAAVNSVRSQAFYSTSVKTAKITRKPERKERCWGNL